MFNIDEAIANENNLYAWNTELQRMEFSYKDEILERYQNLFTNLFPDLNLDASTPQGQLITALTQEDLATVAYCENILNSFFFGGTGLNLDLWAWNTFRVKRKQGTPAQVNILITGVPTTAIPVDFTVTDGTYSYVIKEETTIGASGFVSAVFENTEINQFIAPANTINQFVTVINGVETVNNPSQSIPAILSESDNELFQRCLYFGATATNTSFRSIMANVAQVQGVTKISGAENYSNVDKVVKNITLTPHSICICVVGGTDLNIAEAIRVSRATGCNMIGNTEVEILDNNASYVYKFYRPTPVEIKVRVEVAVSSSSPTNWESLTKDNVVAFVDSLNIADLVTQPNLARYLHRNVSGFDIVDVKFSKLADVFSYASIQLNLNEILTIETINIEVVQV